MPPKASPFEQLLERADRMLTDNHKHAPAAIVWAIHMTSRTAEDEILRQLEFENAPGFTLRELSLGATPWS